MTRNQHVDSWSRKITFWYKELRKVVLLLSDLQYVTSLSNPKSYLYLEAAPYVEDMLNAELAGDWKSWMEV